MALQIDLKYASKQAREERHARSADLHRDIDRPRMALMLMQQLFSLQNCIFFRFKHITFRKKYRFALNLKTLSVFSDR